MSIGLSAPYAVSPANYLATECWVFAWQVFHWVASKTPVFPLEGVNKTQQNMTIQKRDTTSLDVIPPLAQHITPHGTQIPREFAWSHLTTPAHWWRWRHSGATTGGGGGGA